MSWFISQPEYEQAFDAHVLLTKLSIQCPSEEVTKAIMESIFAKPPNEDVRYRLAMYLFLQVYKLTGPTLKRVYTRLEDALVYLSNDTSPFVVEAFHLSLVVLREKDLVSYKKCLKVLRPAVEQRSQEVCESLTLKLHELLAIHTKYQVEPTEASIMCPLFPRSATEYIHYLSVPLDSKAHQNRASHPHSELHKVDTDPRHELGPRFFEAAEENSPGDQKRSNKRTGSKHKKQKSGCTVELLDQKLDKYRQNGSETRLKGGLPKGKPRRGDSEDRSISPQVISRNGAESTKQGVPIYDSKVPAVEQPTPRLRTPRSKKPFGVVQSEHGPLPSPLMSPPEHSFLRSGDGWNPADRRFETFGKDEEEADKAAHKLFSRSAQHLGAGPKRPSARYPNPEQGLQGHLNDGLNNLVNYRDHLETYSQRARNRDGLANKAIVLIVEDLILTGARQDLVRIHEYFLHAFHREENQMEVLSNILDECLYYIQLESSEFVGNLKIVLLTLNEYLRPPNLLTSLLVFSKDLLEDRHILVHPFLRMLDDIIKITNEAHFQTDKHLLIETLSVLQRTQSSWTKQVLLTLQGKHSGRSQATFDSGLSRFPQLETIHKSAHPPPTERLYLLSTIPQMPELSMLKKVQLALAACKGTKPMSDDTASVYRNKKFRDASLLFMTCHRFHCDPFDGNGDWLHDLEDCDTLFEGRAMIHFLCAALKKRHFQMSRATSNDWLITIAEFTRRLLFDKQSQQQAKEVLKLCILAMKLNGIGHYTYLFLPQEVSLLAEF